MIIQFKTFIISKIDYNLWTTIIIITFSQSLWSDKTVKVKNQRDYYTDIKMITITIYPKFNKKLFDHAIVQAYNCRIIQ